MLSSELWHSWNQRLPWCILTVCLGVWIQAASAQGAAAEVTDARVGQTATLTAPATVNIVTSTWYRGTAVTASQLICTSFVSPPSQVNGPQYTGRETCRPDGSLEIRDLLTNYTGNYTVNAQPSGANAVVATRQLRVYEPVTKPTVTWAPSQLVENGGPAVITCNDSKAATTILWYFNRSPDLPANIRLTADNRTLAIAKVSRGDSGTYQCVAMNPVSSSASDPRALTVAYGPEDVGIVPPGPHSAQNGTQLSLSCTAGSFPDPRYQWSLNGTELKSTAGQYIKERVSFQDGGIYTCVAENTVTGLTVNTSVSVSVVVTGSPCPTPCSCWQTTLGVACGVLLGAAVILAVMAVHYERRLKQNDTNKGENVFQNPRVIKNADIQYENMKKGHEGQSADQGSAADPAYMELKHGDRAIYEQFKRP